jgi:hypothetical protein
MKKVLYILILITTCTFSQSLRSQNNPDSNHVKQNYNPISGVNSQVFNINYSFLNTDSNIRSSLLSGTTSIYLNGEKAHDIIRQSWKSDLILFAFLVIFIIIAYFKVVKSGFMNELLFSVQKEEYIITELHRQKRASFYSKFFLDLVFIILVSVFITKFFHGSIRYNFRMILFGVLVVFFFQFVVISIFYKIFFGSRTFNIHLINLLVFNRFLAIFLSPLVFLMLYVPEPYSLYISMIIIILSLITLLIRTFRIFIQLKRVSSFNFLYIILYICVFEISLYFVIIKEFSRLTY